MAGRNLKQNGFTIIELMVATLVFSVVLLVVTAGVLSFTHQYFKGMTSNATQTVARTIAARITQDLQDDPSTSLTPPDPSATSASFCLDNEVYRFALGFQVESSPNSAYPQYQASHGLVVVPTNCSHTSDDMATLAGENGASELLGQHMRLGELRIQSLGGAGSHLYQVQVKVIYGDWDLLSSVPTGTFTADNWLGENCKGSQGSQFCSTSQLTTQVDKRL